jgi:hypothetical protein
MKSVRPFTMSIIFVAIFFSSVLFLFLSPAQIFVFYACLISSVRLLVAEGDATLM